jgi:hypothetical protein
MNQKANELSEKVDAAFRATATTVFDRAKQTGTPVIVWEAGHIKEIPTEKLALPTEQPTTGEKAGL